MRDETALGLRPRNVTQDMEVLCYNAWIFKGFELGETSIDILPEIFVLL